MAIISVEDVNDNTPHWLPFDDVRDGPREGVVAAVVTTDQEDVVVRIEFPPQQTATTPKTTKTATTTPAKKQSLLSSMKQQPTEIKQPTKKTTTSTSTTSTSTTSTKTSSTKQHKQHKRHSKQPHKALRKTRRHRSITNYLGRTSNRNVTKNHQRLVCLKAADDDVTVEFSKICRYISSNPLPSYFFLDHSG